MREYKDACEHAEHEYVGTIKQCILFDSSNVKLPVDVYFTDSTGGHEPSYHGCCLRYSDEPSNYLSYSEMHQIEKHPVLWQMYCRWCETRDYEAQSYEWLKKSKYWVGNN